MAMAPCSGPPDVAPAPPDLAPPFHFRDIFSVADRKGSAMATEYLKQGISLEDRADADARVRATVEATLADIDARGDAAVRELSVKFDKYDPPSFRLSEQDIEDAMAPKTPKPRSFENKNS